MLLCLLTTQLDPCDAACLAYMLSPMKRSEINAAIKEAQAAFEQHQWILPPNPHWDVTDFGLGNFQKMGLVLVNLSEQPEYCEKIMYVKKGQVTPHHRHAAKKEDIICRWGQLIIDFPNEATSYELQINGEMQLVPTDKPLVLEAGDRVTLTQNVPHAFWAGSEYAIVGEVSTANDDTSDNYFEDPTVGRFSEVEEDEPPLARLVGEQSEGRA